jgi:hypothetical protein
LHGKNQFTDVNHNFLKYFFVSSDVKFLRAHANAPDMKQNKRNGSCNYEFIYPAFPRNGAAGHPGKPGYEYHPRRGGRFSPTRY